MYKWMVTNYNFKSLYFMVDSPKIFVGSEKCTEARKTAIALRKEEGKKEKNNSTPKVNWEQMCAPARGPAFFYEAG